MNKTQEVLLEHVLEKVASKRAELTGARKKAQTIPLPELPEGIYKPGWWRMFAFTIGFSPENVHTVFELFKEAGWECISDTPDDIIAKLKTGDDYNDMVHWHHDDFKGMFMTEFQIGADGSNCKRVKIGTKTVEENVYEVVCDEGIEEVSGDSN